MWVYISCKVCCDWRGVSCTVSEWSALLATITVLSLLVDCRLCCKPVENKKPLFRVRWELQTVVFKTNLVTRVTRWRNGKVRASDLRSSGRGFDSRPSSYLGLLSLPPLSCIMPYSSVGEQIGRGQRVLVGDDVEAGKWHNFSGNWGPHFPISTSFGSIPLSARILHFA